MDLWFLQLFNREIPSWISVATTKLHSLLHGSRKLHETTFYAQWASIHTLYQRTCYSSPTALKPSVTSDPGVKLELKEMQTAWSGPCAGLSPSVSIRGGSPPGLPISLSNDRLTKCFEGVLQYRPKLRFGKEAKQNDSVVYCEILGGASHAHSLSSTNPCSLLFPQESRSFFFFLSWKLGRRSKKE